MARSLTIGVIGLGSIGECHLRNLQELYPNALITVLTKRKSWSFAAKNTRLVQSEKVFFTLKHDVYIVTNETHKHAKTILRCLSTHPKGIFVEKPLSHSLADLKKIKEQVQKQKTVFVVGYNLQFFKPLLKLKQLLQQKVVGEVSYMRVSVGQDLRAWRKTDYRTSYSSDPKRGGGVVLDLIHDLNYPSWLLEDELQFIAGVSGHISHLDIASEDVADGMFLSRGGVLVSVHQDYLQVPGKRSCEIVGEKGTIVWEWILSGPVRCSIEVRTRGKVQKRVLQEKDKNAMYKDELKSFMKHTAATDAYTNIASALKDMHNATALRSARL